MADLERNYNTCRHELQELVELLKRTTSLNDNEAKTVVNYAIATYGVPRLQKFPALVIYGTGGTGKTTILEIINELAYSPLWLDGTESTYAILRDNLKENSTVLLDEANGVRERLLTKRYSRRSASLPVNRGSSQEDYYPVILNLFGATALHRRRPFKDPAILSRCIVISMRKKNGVEPFDPEDFKPYAEMLEKLAEKIPWESIRPSNGSRITDSWKPLLVVHEYSFGDEEWLNYAHEQIESAQDDLALGQEEESDQVIYQAFLSCALHDHQGLDLTEPAERVLLSDIGKKLKAEGHNFGRWDVGQALRRLSFQTKKVGGSQYAYTGGKHKLVEVGLELGIQDEWLEENRA